jgi:hypothetical protein
VNSWERWHEYDRLDIWVWFWDEWRERAGKWGRRDIKWFIVDDNYEVNIEFDESKVAKYSGLRIDPENPDEESVRSLQTLFNEIWLYNWEIDGDFVKIKDILINYQIENWIITSVNDSAAWYFWTKTFAGLQKDYWSSSGLFIEKYFDNSEKDYSKDYSLENTLTVSQMQNLNAVKLQLEKILDDMYKWDANKIANFKVQFKSALTSIANTDKYSHKRREFLYLVEMLD